MNPDIIRVLRGAWPGPAIEPDPVKRSALPGLGQTGVRYGGATG